MVGTTGDINDRELEAVIGRLGVSRYSDNFQQLEALYGRLGVHRHTNNGQTICLRVDESYCSNSTRLALQELVTHSQQTFRGRKDSKALLLDIPSLWEKATAFIRSHGEFFLSIKYPDSPIIESDQGRHVSQERCVAYILMLEGEVEREKTQRGQ